MRPPARAWASRAGSRTASANACAGRPPNLALDGGGVIIRTAAHGAKREDFERELKYLHKLHEVLVKRVQRDARSRSRLPGGRPVRARRARHLLGALRAGDRGRREAVSAPRVVLLAHRSRARRAGRAVGAGGTAVRGLRRGQGDRGRAVAAGGPAQRRLSDDRLRRGADGDRRQLGQLHQPRQGRRARGHDHQDQPRGRRGGRQPAATARHRRDHRDRLHRHGARAQPRRRHEDAAADAGRGSHEDVHRRDIEARPGRDDPPERDRGRARDHEPAVSDLRRGGRDPLGGDDRDRVRAQAARRGRSSIRRRRPSSCRSTPA